MRYFNLVGVVVFLALMASSGFPSERSTIRLEPSEDLLVCPKPIWKDLPAVWKGVVDERTETAVGELLRRDQEPLPLEPDPPLAQVFDEPLKKLFANCGIQWIAKPTRVTRTIFVRIKEFHVGLQKKFLTGKTSGQSLIEIVIEKRDKGNNSIKEWTTVVGYDLETKGMRQRKLKQLERDLQTLLQKTLEQIPSSPQLKKVE